MVRLSLLFALVSLASCGASNGGTNQETATLPRLELTSGGFQSGQAIPARYTCDGGDQVPMLRWGEPPATTRSFALVLDDPDAPGGTFRHWGVFDIPASARSTGGGIEVTNDFGKRGYGGPCPPKGDGPHHYHFKLFALNVERLGLSANSKAADVERTAERHAMAQGELVGTYERR